MRFFVPLRVLCPNSSSLEQCDTVILKKNVVSDIIYQTQMETQNP